ncbi:GBS Bsp-like repeat-containing protein, partial [Eggerthella lenta]|nr:GBS Bsp-like repeat-containing protein [Eggerthella lenta]
VFPIWSEENGQDDLVWYPAKKIAPGHFQLRFQAQKHKGSGLFHLHVYQKSQGQLKGLFPTTFQVEKAKPKLTPLATHPGNTYPIGECTWGAK